MTSEEDHLDMAQFHYKVASIEMQKSDGLVLAADKSYTGKEQKQRFISTS